MTGTRALPGDQAVWELVSRAIREEVEPGIGAMLCEALEKRTRRGELIWKVDPSPPGIGLFGQSATSEVFAAEVAPGVKAYMGLCEAAGTIAVGFSAHLVLIEDGVRVAVRDAGPPRSMISELGSLWATILGSIDGDHGVSREGLLLAVLGSQATDFTLGEAS